MTTNPLHPSDGRPIAAKEGLEQTGQTPATRRVVHVIDSLGRSGGAEQQLVANLGHFTDPSLVHEVLCLYRATASREDDLPVGVRLSYLLTDGRRVRNRLALILLMRRRLAALRPDLIHCALPDAALAARLAGRSLGIPVIESLVNISHEGVRTIDSPGVTLWKLAMHRWLDRWTMRSVVRFQALSNEVARSWVETVGIPSNRVQVIPRGVEISEGTSTSDRASVRNALFEELSIESHRVEPFLILNVGRQVSQKGQIYAVKALAQVLPDVPEARLVSAGSPGPMSERLRAECERLGVSDRVHWLGVRTDVSELMAAADVFVFPSLYEGLGVSLLQAMAAGLPCVVSDRPPMTEVVRHGDNGFLVPAMDPDAIAATLVRLYRDQSLRKSIADRARSHVGDRFDTVEIAARVEGMYREVLDSRIS